MWREAKNVQNSNIAGWLAEVYQQHVGTRIDDSPLLDVSWSFLGLWPLQRKQSSSSRGHHLCWRWCSSHSFTWNLQHFSLPEWSTLKSSALKWHETAMFLDGNPPVPGFVQKCKDSFIHVTKSELAPISWTAQKTCSVVDNNSWHDMKAQKIGKLAGLKFDPN